MTPQTALERIVPLVLALSAGCQIDDCVFASFVADMQATVRHGGRETTQAFQSGVTAQTVGPRVFAAIETTLLTDASPFDVVIWTVSGTFGELGWGELSVAVPTPLVEGAERTIDTVFQQTGWGESLLPPGAVGAASLRIGGFDAVDAAGTLTVTSKSPLMIRIGVTLVDAGVDSLDVSGDLHVTYHPETGSCQGIAQRLSGS
jgi:hypothetical protein